MQKPRTEETIIMKRREKLEVQKATKEQQEALKKRKQGLKELTVIPPSSYAKTYGKQLKFERNLRLSKQTITAESKFEGSVQPILVIRQLHPFKTSPKVEQMLKLLRLEKQYDAVFVRGDAKTLKILTLLQDFVAFGYLKTETIRDLIYKRGCFSTNGMRVKISDNVVIEEQLGSLDIICMEDLVFELEKCSEKFSKINGFFSVFQLQGTEAKFGKVDKMDEFVRTLV
ncbi:Ribosomal_protein L7 [Hexamita inflata]|uniref:Ribosomal protein L7 n=1 Tax=Hexamita inflata TaxID=28002 RepID=A0AA86QL38_9EUKA|nr:Ribosomal protein L7 [Hexamita inflata]